jgi:hypothetical protein
MKSGANKVTNFDNSRNICQSMVLHSFVQQQETCYSEQTVKQSSKIESLHANLFQEQVP